MHGNCCISIISVGEWYPDVIVMMHVPESCVAETICVSYPVSMIVELVGYNWNNSLTLVKLFQFTERAFMILNAIPLTLLPDEIAFT